MKPGTLCRFQCGYSDLFSDMNSKGVVTLRVFRVPREEILMYVGSEQGLCYRHYFLNKKGKKLEFSSIKYNIDEWAKDELMEIVLS